MTRTARRITPGWLFLLTLIVSTGTPGLAGNAWWNGFATGVDDTVLTLGTHDGDLVVGGEFGQAGALSAANIARWNGNTWANYGSGTDGRVHALGDLLGDLVIGGDFTQAGSFSANNVARWTGSFWTTMGSGLDSTVYDFDNYNGLLSVGAFENSGSSPVSRLGDWNGSAWTELGDGLNNLGVTLQVDGSTLYVAGYFNQAGGDTAFRIAEWDGSSWTTLGGGIHGGFLNNPFVYDMAVYDGDLIVAGGFTLAGSTPVANVARWDGTTWHALGDGVTGTATSGPSAAIYALTVYHGDLIAGGDFTLAGGAPASNIARWDGSSWESLASGITGGDGTVFALEVLDDSLFAGGNFTHAGALPSVNIARWDEPPPITGSGRIQEASLQIGKTILPTFFDFTWGDSCSSDDTDYAVYEGDLDDPQGFTNHVQHTCTTSGSTNAFLSLHVDRGNYYLVVPRNAIHEGAYGTDSNGTPRPQSTNACVTQQLLDCP